MNREINLIDVLNILIRNRWLIFKIIFFTTLFSLFLSLIWPKTYKSSIQFFPPPRQQSGITGIFSNLLQPMVSTSELNQEALMVILNSRTVKEQVIDKFNYREIYNSDIPEFLIKQMESNIIISDIREGGFGFNPLIAVEFSFIDKDPKRAADVCKFYIEKVDSILKSLNTERVLKTKNIVETRYLENIAKLNEAEMKLQNFQKMNGIFEIESQTKTIINTMAEIKSKIIQLEIQLDIMKKVASAENYEILNIITEKNAYEKKYQEFYRKSDSLLTDDIFHSIDEMPRLSREYAQLYRDVVIQNKIYEYIYPQYEQMKMQVKIQAQGVQILDPAQIPT
ncbi:MAG: hypothetical protein JXL67_06935, partial [Calditrichaeota bacterium]|nr:hypothetical protein [Calditrichota bacterium]